jgi:hypothetical protein
LVCGSWSFSPSPNWLPCVTGAGRVVIHQQTSSSGANMPGTAPGGWPDATPRSSAARTAAAAPPRSNPRRPGHQCRPSRQFRLRAPSVRTTATPRWTARLPPVGPALSTGAGSRASRHGGPPARQPAGLPGAGIRVRRYIAANVRKRHARNASTIFRTHRRIDNGVHLPLPECIRSARRWAGYDRTTPSVHPVRLSDRGGRLERAGRGT